MVGNKVAISQNRLSRNAYAIALLYNLAGLIFSAVALASEAESPIVDCCLLFPVIGVAIVLWSMGLIGLNFNVKWQEKPGILFGIGVTTMALALHAVRDYNLFRYTELIIACGFITALITFLLYSKLIKYQVEKSFVQLIFTLVPVAIYTFGALIIVNCNFDLSAPLKFNTVVEGKFTKKGKYGKRYHLTLAPLERGQSPLEIEVTPTEYEQTPVDGPVGGHIKQGFLKIRWFYLDL